MALIIATDEAGYGPKLGPLVIAASAWQVDEAMLYQFDAEQLFSSLAQGIRIGKQLRLAFLDSKQLYQGKGGAKKAALANSGLGSLELGLATAVRWLFKDAESQTLQRLLEKVAPLDLPHLTRRPWYLQTPSPFPVCAEVVALEDSHWQQADQWLSASPAKLVAIAARVIDECRFNVGCDTAGNKASLLSETTIGLARQLIEDLNIAEPTTIYCDRHGGRSRYSALIQHCFPDSFPQIVRESSRESVYRIEFCKQPIEWRFTVGGDAFAPVGLASIVAKYTRERLMEDFNRFWQEAHSSSLTATAGYPVDASRFVDEIEPTRQRLKISLQDLVRNR